MPVYEEEPVVERRVVEPAPVRESAASFAFVKYGFILAITIVILYFLSTQVLSRF